MKRLIAIMGALLVLTLLLYALACDNKPTQPPPEEEKDYVVWMYNIFDKQRLIGYHPTTGDFDTLIVGDSLLDAFEWITVSANGETIFGVVRFERIDVIDLTTLSVSTQIPYSFRNRVIVSPNGEYIATMGRDFHVRQASDFQDIFHDTTRIGDFGHFARSSVRLYSYFEPGPEPGRHIYRIDISQSPPDVSTRYILQGSPYYVVPTLNESRLLLYLSYGSSGGFAVYDTLLDSVVFTDFFSPGSGEIAMTPDGKWAFYGNPGNALWGPGESIIKVFDIENNRIDEEVVTNIHGDTTAPSACLIGNIVVTPDGRFLVGLDAPKPNQLVCYDIVKKEIIDYKYFGEDTWISNVTVQLQP